MNRLRLLAAVLVLLGTATAGEPTNAAEAAKKAAEDKRINEQYQQKVATLSPERQAWEKILQENLGDAFYLPVHKRAFVKGTSTAWDYVADNPKLPRVLLIGDSISRGYTQAVRATLAGKANVHRAPENCGPTANGLKKLDVWLGPGRWDVIVFNFGIHDRATPEADYEQRLETLAARLKATGAKLVWASSTPFPAQSRYGSDALMVARNAIAARLMHRHGVPIVDLHGLVTPRLAEFQQANDVHFSEAGYQFLGRHIATAITAQLPARR